MIRGKLNWENLRYLFHSKFQARLQTDNLNKDRIRRKEGQGAPPIKRFNSHRVGRSLKHNTIPIRCLEERGGCVQFLSRGVYVRSGGNRH